MRDFSRARQPCSARRAGGGAATRRPRPGLLPAVQAPPAGPSGAEPSSRSRSCQAMSWWRTCKMPCRHSRSGAGLGAADRSGHGSSSGSIRTHKSSSTIHGRVVTRHKRPDHHIGHARPRHPNEILLRALCDGCPALSRSHPCGPDCAQAEVVAVVDADTGGPVRDWHGK